MVNGLQLFVGVADDSRAVVSDDDDNTSGGGSASYTVGPGVTSLVRYPCPEPMSDVYPKHVDP